MEPVNAADKKTGVIRDTFYILKRRFFLDEQDYQLLTLKLKEQWMKK
jgi:hypothetical protein